jgi:hypothetical protein
VNNSSTEEKVKRIKQSFRLYMNGETAASLREKGLHYKICWGVSMQHLQEMAAEYGKDRDVAEELWKSEVRECKLLAILTYPPEQFSEQTADCWLASIDNQELAEQLVFHILSKVSYSKPLALRLLQSGNKFHLLCAFNLLGRLFMKQISLADEDVTLYRKRAEVCLSGNDLALKHAVTNSLMKFEEYSN